MSVIPAFRRLTQEDCHKFQDSLGYTLTMKSRSSGHTQLLRQFKARLAYILS